MSEDYTAQEQETLVDPQPDTEGARSPFAEIERPLQPRVGENDRAYSAFLLYCMQAERSIRKIGKAMQISTGSLRYWRKKHHWERRRVSCQTSDWSALKAYRMLMDLQVANQEVAALRVAMDIVLDDTGFSHLRHAVAAQRKGMEAGPKEHDVDPMDKHGTSKSTVDTTESKVVPFKSPLSDDELKTLDVQQHYRKLRESILTNHLRPDDVKRQIGIIDATLGLIAQKIASRELEVKVSDIPALLKARAMLTGLPTEHVAIQSQHNHQHTVVVESTRMRDARGKGEPEMLQAIQEELDELQVIVNAVPKKIIEVQSE